jgi:hypothetical protein
MKIGVILYLILLIMYGISDMQFLIVHLKLIFENIINPLYLYATNNQKICDDEYEIHTMINEIMVSEIEQYHIMIIEPVLENDHVLNDTMYLVQKNGITYFYDGDMQKINR